MIAVLFLAFQMATAPLSYEQAKALADSHEASLSPSAKGVLIKAQGDALDGAFATCGNRAESPIKPFTVVVHVNGTGAADQTWLQGDTALALCVQKELTRTRLPASDGQSFYASYEFSFVP